MARNKARRPGAPSGAIPASEASPARPEAMVEGDAEAPAHQPGSAAELSGAPSSPPEEGSTGAAGPGAEGPDSPALEAAGETGAGARPSAGAPLGGASPADPAPGSAAAPPRSSRSWLAGVIGGLIGGGIVALAAYLLPQEPAGLSEVRGQLDQLRQSVSEIEQPASQGLLPRVESLEAATRSEEVLPRLEAVEAAAAGVQDLPARLQALESAGASLGERIASLEEQLASIEASAGSGVAPERVATLESELADLEASVARLQGAAPSAGAAGDQAVADLASRIGTLEGRLGRAEGAGDQIDGLASRIGAVEQQMTAGRQQATGLTDDVVSLSGQVGALSTRVDALAEGLDQLQQRIASAEERRTQGATLAGTVAQLDAAIEQGQPFADLLDGLRDQEDGAVRQAVEDLRPVAASGVPGLAALRSSFDAVANQIVHAARAPEGDGLLQQAAGNLMSLVTVRPVGADVEGDSTAARVARAEAALDDGDLAGAVSELEALDGPAAAAAAPWLAEARPRLAAEAALNMLQERATLLLVERP
jgi:phage shock protein A